MPDNIIFYPQGVRYDLMDSCSNLGIMEAVLLQLAGHDAAGSCMCFHHTLQNGTLKKWATRQMKMKLVLPIELVRPLIAWATIRNRTESGKRNKGAPYMLEVPTPDGGYLSKHPDRVAKRQRNAEASDSNRYAKRQRALEQEDTEDSLRFSPYANGHGAKHRSGLHALEYASTMQDLRNTPGLPDWWYPFFWKALPNVAQ